MPLTIVKRALSGRLPDAFAASAKETLDFLRQELVPLIKELRAAFNSFASGPYDFGTVMSGTGVPTLPPSADRAIYIQLDGGALTTLWVWNGIAWEAK